jgi:hypothetical protein
MFARSFAFPVALSLITLPIVIRSAGIDIWVSVVAGQGLGLILSEFVEGGWIRIAPSIHSKFGSRTHSLYSVSIIEKTPRFFLAGIVGTLILFLFFDTYFIFASLSFLSWLMSGISPLWMTVGTSQSKYIFRYWVIPRLLSVTLGTVLLFENYPFWIFLVCQVLAGVCGIALLMFFSHSMSSKFELSNFLSRNEQIRYIIAGLASTLSSWILVIILGTSKEMSTASMVAMFRYSEFVYAISYIFPQSQHGSLLVSQKSIDRSKSHRTSFYSTVIFVLFAYIFFHPINQLLFDGVIELSNFEVCCVLLTVPIRIFIRLLIQDHLVLLRKSGLVLLIESILSLISIATCFFTMVLFDKIDYAPQLYVSMLSLLFLFLMILSDKSRVQIKEWFRWEM